MPNYQKTIDFELENASSDSGFTIGGREQYASGHLREEMPEHIYFGSLGGRADSARLLAGKLQGCGNIVLKIYDAGQEAA